MNNFNNNSRRKFIKNTTKTVALFTIGNGVSSHFLAACSVPKISANKNKFITSFDQQPLPYAYNALENIIDAKTMEIHYSKHAAGYSKNLKDAVIEEAVTEKNIVPILQNISKYSIKMRNNAGGHYNHEFFWQCMQPKHLAMGNEKVANIPDGRIAKAIDKTFGSFDNFKKEFAEAGKSRFGSGWVWLYIDVKDFLRIGSTANQDNPLMDVSNMSGTQLLLALDIWEHAYYLKYQNKRADYIENWWQVVNWKFVESRL